MPVIGSLDEPLLAELLAYWSQQRQGRFAPARRDIDPVDIPQLLPHVALTEIIHSGDGTAPRFRYRLAGTQIEERFGCSLTNRFLDELKRGAYLDFIEELYARMMAEKVPIYSENTFETDDLNKLQAKRLMLPLSDDGETVNMVLAGVIYVDSNPNYRSTILALPDRASESENC